MVKRVVILWLPAQTQAVTASAALSETHLVCWWCSQPKSKQNLRSALQAALMSCMYHIPSRLLFSRPSSMLLGNIFIHLIWPASAGRNYADVPSHSPLPFTPTPSASPAFTAREHHYFRDGKMFKWWTFFEVVYIYKNKIKIRKLGWKKWFKTFKNHD